MKKAAPPITVAVFGLGLIGGSLGMALRSAGRGTYRVIGIGRNAHRLARARRKGAVDAWTLDIADGVRDADILVFCTPVATIAPLVQAALPFMKPGACITDAGSVKGPVVAAVHRLLARSGAACRGICFVGSHPMAGSECSGIEAARADLYAGATVAVTPVEATPAGCLAAVKSLWLAAGAHAIELSPAEHDRIVAVISHLPHLIAFSLAAVAGKTAARQHAVARLAAGSFRDVTRIAASNPQDWAGICAANTPAVARAVDAFTAELQRMKKYLARPRRLAAALAAAHQARQALIKK